MTRLTRSIHLALLSSALILAGCKKTRPPEGDFVLPPEERRPLDQAGPAPQDQALGLATAVGLAAPPGEPGLLLAPLVFHPEGPTAVPLDLTSRPQPTSRSGAHAGYYRWRYFTWGRSYPYRYPVPSPGVRRPWTGGAPGGHPSTISRGGFGATGHATAGG
jgi:hypothetical protein